MTPKQERRVRRAHALRVLLNRHGTRVVLSVLILLSLCPFAFVDRLWWIFFAVFGLELLTRLYVLNRAAGDDSEDRRPSLEIGLIALDFIAWLSFLPLAEMTGLRFLRLVRFIRLGMLFGYWGQTVRLLWSLLNRTERTRQLKLLGLGVVGMVFVSAAILSEIASKSDAEALGIDGKPRFLDYIWWSYRQLEDPGNLIADADRLGIVLLSVAMTLGGIILLSFIVGICTSVVSDLLEASRERSLGYRGHSILVNAGEHSSFFIDQLVAYSRKQLSRPRWMVLGQQSDGFERLADPAYRGIEYRHGSPYLSDDLAKIDAGTAKRVVALANTALAEPDPDTISAVLSIRQVNNRARLFAEVHDEGNASALVAAGDPELTTVVATDHLIAVVLANLLAIPENDRVIDELLTARGCEIYSTCKTDHLDCLPVERLGHFEDFGTTLRWAYESFGCVILGWSFLEPLAHRHRIRHQLNPAPPSADDRLVGVLGLAHTRADLLAAVDMLSERGARLELPPTDGEAPAFSFELAPPATPKDAPNILICGYRRRTALLIEHLIRFFPMALVTLMVPDDESRQQAHENLAGAGLGLDEYGDTEAYDPGLRGRFVRGEDDTFTYRFPRSDEIGGTIRLTVGDWSSRTDLLRPRDDGFDLFEVDEILLQSSVDKRGDPDAKTVLTLLKLENLRRHEHYAARFKKSLRLVAEMVDPLKARLIERRFGSFGEGSHLPVAVINTEWLRHTLMFQATVVPEFSGVFLDLFSQCGQSLRRLPLAFSDSSRVESITFGQLLERIFDSHRMILLGVEVEANGNRQVLLAPRPTELESTLKLHEVKAAYVVGSPG